MIVPQPALCQMFRPLFPASEPSTSTALPTLYHVLKYLPYAQAASDLEKLWNKRATPSKGSISDLWEQRNTPPRTAGADLTNRRTPSKQLPIVAPPAAVPPAAPQQEVVETPSKTPSRNAAAPTTPATPSTLTKRISFAVPVAVATPYRSPKVKEGVASTCSPVHAVATRINPTPTAPAAAPVEVPTKALAETSSAPDLQTVGIEPEAAPEMPCELPPLSRPPMLTPLPTSSTPLSPKAKPFYPRSRSLGRESTTPLSPSSTPLSPKAKPFYPRSHSLGREPTAPLDVAAADVMTRTPSKRLPIVAPIEAPPAAAVPNTPSTPLSPKAKPFYPRSHSLGREESSVPSTPLEFMPPTPSSRGRSLVRSQPPQTPTLLSPNAKPFWPRQMYEESPARPHDQAPDVSSLMSPQIPLAPYRIPESPVTPFPALDLSRLPNPTCAPTMAQAKAITEFSKFEALWKTRTTPGKAPKPTSPAKEAAPALTDSETWSSVDWWSPGLKMKKDCGTQSSPRAVEEPKQLFADSEMSSEGSQESGVGDKTMTEAEFKKLLVDSDTIRSPQAATMTCDMGTDPSPEPLMMSLPSKASKKVKDHLKHTRSTLKKRRTALSVFHGDWAEKMVATQVQHEMEHEVHQPKDSWAMTRSQVSTDDTVVCMETETVMCMGDGGMTTVKAPKHCEPDSFQCMETTVVKDLKSEITVKDPQCQTRPEPGPTLPALRPAPVDDDEETEGEVSPAFSDLSLKTAMSHHTEKPTEKRAGVRINPRVTYEDPVSPTMSEPTTPRAGPTMLDILTSPVTKFLGGARRAMNWLSTPAAPETTVRIDTKVRRKPGRATARRAGLQGTCLPARRSGGRISIRAGNVTIELTDA